jgi:hypothetical protein
MDTLPLFAPVVERWAIIPTTDGHYEASDAGRVRRAAPGPRTRVGAILQPCFTNDGHLQVSLNHSGRRYTRQVHTLVMLAFAGEMPAGDMTVNHINGVKTDNRLENLEYVTRAENIRHAFKNGLNRPIALKLTPEKVSHIRSMLGSLPNVRIARMFGVSDKMIAKIRDGKVWKYVA